MNVNITDAGTIGVFPTDEDLATDLFHGYFGEGILGRDCSGASQRKKEKDKKKSNHKLKTSDSKKYDGRKDNDMLI